MKSPHNQITAHNAGWPSQFRFAGSVFWSGVCEFHRWQMSVKVRPICYENPQTFESVL